MAGQGAVIALPTSATAALQVRHLDALADAIVSRLEGRFVTTEAFAANTRRAADDSEELRRMVVRCLVDHVCMHSRCQFGFK